MLNTLISDLQTQQWIQYLLRQKNIGIYIVGGCVRDAFMNKHPKDIDIVIEGTTLDNVKELLKSFGKLNIVGESFSVIKFRPKGHTGEDYDIAVPRRDRKIGAGHKGIKAETEGVDINSDLKRRDFTVNSMAVNVATGKLLDPFGGKQDLIAKVLRATDITAFNEDPLRMVRAIQFASRFRFDIEPKTLSLMKKNAPLIKEISGERIKEEFDKILMKGGSTRVAFDLIEKSDLDKAMFGKKFYKDGFEYFDNLDLVSFYYVLGNLGNVTASTFYKNRLKGEYDVFKALLTLEKHFDKFDENKPEQLRWNVFQMLKTSPMTADAKVLPRAVHEVIDMMKAGKIPMKEGDISVNGNDIMNLFSAKNEEVGKIKNRMYYDALMNKYNWKNRNATIEYLKLL